MDREFTSCLLSYQGKDELSRLKHVDPPKTEVLNVSCVFVKNNIRTVIELFQEYNTQPDSSTAKLWKVPTFHGSRRRRLGTCWQAV